MLATILQVVGVTVISVAVGVVYWPAGLVLAGVGCLLFGLALDKGGK